MFGHTRNCTSSFTTFMATFIAASVLAAVPPLLAAEPKQPNIVLMMADDLGQYALGAYGGIEFSTPQIDKLAREGMMLTNCHSRAMCTPTRNVLLTGKGLHRATGKERRPAKPTLASVLKQAGYHTGFAGKWMTGGMPWDAGFEEGVCQVNWYRFWGPHVVVWNSGGYLKELNLPASQRDGITKDHGIPIEGPQPRATHLDGEYGPRVLNRFVLDYIERHKDEPFFLYYPLKLPHSPIMPTPDTPRDEKAERTINASNQLPVNGDNYSIPSNREAWEDDTVREIDRLVGHVVARLEEYGLTDNTMLIFTSDNGPGTDSRIREHVTRIPGGKGGTLEGGTRAPFIVRWPDGVEPGRVCGDLVDFADVLPTLADAAGIPAPSDTSYDGRSFLPQVRGDPGNPRRYIYFHGGWHESPTSRELLKGMTFRSRSPLGFKPKSEPRINYEFSRHFRYVRGLRYKLYSDGRFYDLVQDLQEWHPIKPGTGSSEAEAARESLQAVLDSMPQKHKEPVGAYKYE